MRSPFVLCVVIRLGVELLRVIILVHLSIVNCICVCLTLNTCRVQDNPTQDIINLITLILTKNNFSFDDKHYLQIKGTTMGTRMAPSYANIFIDDLKRNILANVEKTPSIWWRYIDDIFAILPYSQKHLRIFIQYIIECHPSIKFTAEWSSRSVTFLDTRVMVDNEGRLITDLNVKPTDTHQYLHRDSCHLGHCKRSIPYSQALRICRICSETRDYLQRSEELKKFLINRGYNENKIQQQIIRTKGLDRDALLLSRKRTKGPLNRVPFIVTYHPCFPPLNSILTKHSSILNVSERLRRAVSNPPLVTYHRPPSQFKKLIG